MRKFKAKSIIYLLASLTACANETPAHTEEPVNMYAREEDAAYEHAMNRPTAVPLASLPKGATVTVLKDVYGKDYWACLVRASSGLEGWVLCTSLDYAKAG